MASTAKIASPITGDKLYQERARAALPLLVRQAKAAKPIFYSALAQELGMPNPRNLNYILGSIGQALVRLSKHWKEKVPPIQCLVVSKATGIPGEGIGWFLVSEDDFGKLPLRRRREIVHAELEHIYSYPHWDDVLAHLDLQPVETDFTEEIARASSGFGGGESEEHKRLKEFVAMNPSVIGLPKTTHIGKTEYRLPSGDCLDISFRSKRSWIAVEVKSRTSSHQDLARGIFQCIKYQAILDAVLIAESQTSDARVLLVLEESLPESLQPLCNLLGVDVVDCINPK